MHYSLNQSQQNGAALLVSMIILLVMSLIILQGARTANLELLIGNNTQHAAAEALLQAEDSAVFGEQGLELNYAGAPTNNYGESSTDGVFLVGQIDVDTVEWASLDAEHDSNDGHHREYIVEYIGPMTAVGGSVSVGTGSASITRYIYRVSGRGESSRGGARVVQTIYAMAE